MIVSALVVEESDGGHSRDDDVLEDGVMKGSDKEDRMMPYRCQTPILAENIPTPDGMSLSCFATITPIKRISQLMKGLRLS